MPDTCCVAGCPNVGTHGGVVRYYIVPQIINNKGDEIKQLSTVQREKWIASVKAKKPNWEPNRYSRICSLHFVSGRKANLTDVKNPDWVPSLFMGASSDDKQQDSETITLIKGLVAKKIRETQAVVPVNDKPIAVYMLTSTHDRWKDVKKELSLQSDDAVATYLLDLFEAGLHPVQSSGHQVQAGVHTVKKTTAFTSQAMTPQASTNSRDGEKTRLPEGVKTQLPEGRKTPTEGGKTRLPKGMKPHLPADTQQASTSKVADQVDVASKKNEDEDTNTTASPTSVSMATSNANDVIDISFTQCIGVKKENDTIQESVNKLTKSEIVSSGPQVEPISPNKTPTDTNDDDKVRVEWHPPNLPATAGSSNAAGPLFVISKSFLAKLNKKSVAVSNNIMKPVHYMCNCNKRFPSPELLEEHKLEVHGTVDKYKCRHCCLTYKTRSGLTRHNVRDHPGPGNKPYPCATCDKSFTDKQSLIRHQRIHSEHSNLQCEFCQRKFKDRYKWRKHKAEVHVRKEDDMSKVTGFECSQCGFVYKTQNALSNHESSNCEGWAKLRNTMSCMQCKMSFEDFKLLKEHLKDVHKEELNLGDTDAKDVMSICGCGKVLHGKNAAVIHICPQRQMCPHCDKTFKHAISLQQHIACKHSENKPEYKCKHCDRVYNRLHNLRSHERTHTTGRKSYQCKQCPKAYIE
ncbi:uncharacterized protein [Amphiura filiformis]|uniref:uncharacterized protein n=1 Tax=Amphiura filiformis TaxID=82378 RepID=UPI003B210978